MEPTSFAFAIVGVTELCLKYIWPDFNIILQIG